MVSVASVDVQDERLTVILTGQLKYEDIRPPTELELLKMPLMSFCKCRWLNAIESSGVSSSSFAPVNILVFGAE